MQCVPFDLYDEEERGLISFLIFSEEISIMDFVNAQVYKISDGSCFSYVIYGKDVIMQYKFTDKGYQTTIAWLKDEEIIGFHQDNKFIFWDEASSQYICETDAFTKSFLVARDNQKPTGYSYGILCKKNGACAQYWWGQIFVGKQLLESGDPYFFGANMLPDTIYFTNELKKQILFQYCNENQKYTQKEKFKFSRSTSSSDVKKRLEASFLETEVDPDLIGFYNKELEIFRLKQMIMSQELNRGLSLRFVLSEVV